jgi:CheY-like chemotaxis protein
MVSARVEEEAVVSGLDVGAGGFDRSNLWVGRIARAGRQHVSIPSNPIQSNQTGPESRHRIHHPDDYITKPFKRNEFLARIRAKLEMVAGEEGEAALDGLGDLSLAAPLAPLPLDGSSHGGAAGAQLPPAASGGLPSAADPAADAGSLARRSAGGVASPAGGAPWVLCVDDDEVNQLVLQGMLDSQEYR